LGEIRPEKFSCRNNNKINKNISFIKDDFVYDFEQSIQTETRLDKNHSHFILIKSENNPNGCVDFKNKLSNQFNNYELSKYKNYYISNYTIKFYIKYVYYYKWFQS